MNDTHFKFIEYAPVVGYWRISNITFAQHRRPRWLTRVLCKWLLQWEWEDAKPR